MCFGCLTPRPDKSGRGVFLIVLVNDVINYSPNFMRFFLRFSTVSFTFLLLSFGFSQDPPGIKWKQIQTDHYQIIFPLELSAEGNRVANVMEHVHRGINHSLEGKHRGIPILLSNRSAIPNGFVAQAPWMSEWYNVPLMLKEMGSTEWYRDLAVHEGRHMVQTNFMNSGVNRFLGKIFGEATQSLYTGFLVPSWYWEGDAVGIETMLTQSGRGRSPFFNRTSRGLLMEGKPFNYRQAFYGSYKEDYPDHYELGYFLTGHVKREFGQNAWPEIIRGTMRWPFIINPVFPLSRSMKKTTGLSLIQNYRDTFHNLKKFWAQQLDQVDESPAEILSPQTKIKTNFLYPALTPEGDIIALKTGLGDVPTLVKIANGDERELTKISSFGSVFGFHTNGRQAVWTAYDPDKRWTKQSWANIRVFDIELGITRKITSKKRLYNPNISRDGEKITAVSFSESRKSELVIIDLETGEFIDRIEAPGGGVIMSPSWSKDGMEIVFTSQKNEGRAIFIYHIENRQVKRLKTESWMEVFKPVFYKDFVIYESPLAGIDNLVAIRRRDKRECQVTSRIIGAYNPFVTHDNRLLFNDYSTHGNAVVVMDLDPMQWDEILALRENPIQGPYGNLAFESIFEEPIPDKSYHVSNYKPWANILNFHSRYIFDSEFNPTLGIQSDNILGTLSIRGEVSFNQNEKTKKTGIIGTYKGLYPIFDFELGFGDRSLESGPFAQAVDNTKDTIKYKVNEKWNESSFDIGITLPIQNRKKGIATQYAYGKLGGKYTVRSNTFFHFKFLKIPPNIRVKDKQKRDDRDGAILPLYLESGIGSTDEKSPRDLGNPGWQVYGYVGQTPLGGLWKGDQVSLRLHYGRRGFGKHHFISILFQYETNEGDYIIPSKVTFPSGYQWRIFESAWRAKVKYKIPLFYPDWALPFGVSYLKRIQGNLFVDQVSVDGSDPMVAVGAGITFETAGFFDVKFPIPITFNYYYHPNSGKSGIQLHFE